MDRETVVSSNVDSIGYDGANEILEVEFKGGAVYQYKDVPADVYAELKEAASVGRYLSDCIKNVFEYERV